MYLCTSSIFSRAFGENYYIHILAAAHKRTRISLLVVAVVFYFLIKFLAQHPSRGFPMSSVCASLGFFSFYSFSLLWLRVCVLYAPRAFHTENDGRGQRSRTRSLIIYFTNRCATLRTVYITPWPPFFSFYFISFVFASRGIRVHLHFCQ